jgi:hypothetical protein
MVSSPNDGSDPTANLSQARMELGSEGEQPSPTTPSSRSKVEASRIVCSCVQTSRDRTWAFRHAHAHADTR